MSSLRQNLDPSAFRSTNYNYLLIVSRYDRQHPLAVESASNTRVVRVLGYVCGRHGTSLTYRFRIEKVTLSRFKGNRIYPGLLLVVL